MNKASVIRNVMIHLTEISADHAAQELDRIRERADMDLATSMAGVLKKGIKKGRAEGRAESKLKFLTAMLQSPFTSSVSKQKSLAT